MARSPSLRDSPEFNLIDRIRALAAKPAGAADVRIGIGDDAAVVAVEGVRVTSIDASVEGVHFRTRWCDPRSAGYRAVAAALSDLAAMGAAAEQVYVWAGLPEELGGRERLEVGEGVVEAAHAAGADLLGGDLTAAPVLSLCVTVVGAAARTEDLVGRDGAGAGDAICVTGSLGLAAAGLMLAEHPDLEARAPEEARRKLRDRLLRPVPRLEAGMALARGGATAMLDVSDGLGADASQLAAASGVSLELELARVPSEDSVREVAGLAGVDPLELIASGGEDYELLCAVPRARLEPLRAELAGLGLSLTEIGVAGDGAGVRLRLPGGRSLPVGGHDHLRR